MLVALTNRGALFSLCNMNLTKQELFQLRKKEIFYCPSCNQEVSSNLVLKIAWHFAHKK
ncbi:hypothetical protein KHA80_18290 [Anaerobacillus sp. HL2]|nr:hypothetical protein KHA80_18290 [Anaerobacillus sp. HL2]